MNHPSIAMWSSRLHAIAFTLLALLLAGMIVATPVQVDNSLTNKRT